MAVLARLTSISILVVSFLLAMLFYYVISQKTKADKRQTLEYVTSMLINLVIYVWLAKLVLNFKVFIKDPIAVLAYPSHSQAFYLALMLTLIHFFIQRRKDPVTGQASLDAFVPIFLSASFFYEFIYLVSGEQVLTSLYLFLVFGLLIALLLTYDKVNQFVLHLTLMIVWALGLVILTYYLPYLAIFGYLISPYFALVLLVIFVSLLFYGKRKVIR